MEVVVIGRSHVSVRLPRPRASKHVIRVDENCSCMRQSYFD